MSRLPRDLATIEAVAGTAAALELARQFGGTDIALSAAPGSVLVRTVGEEKAQAIVRALGNGKLSVPMANLRGQRARHAKIAELLEKGATVRQVALACDTHTRSVFRRKAKRKAPKPEGDLFE